MSLFNNFLGGLGAGFETYGREQGKTERQTAAALQAENMMRLQNKFAEDRATTSFSRQQGMAEQANTWKTEAVDKASDNALKIAEINAGIKRGNAAEKDKEKLDKLLRRQTELLYKEATPLIEEMVTANIEAEEMKGAEVGPANRAMAKQLATSKVIKDLITQKTTQYGMLAGLSEFANLGLSGNKSSPAPLLPPQQGAAQVQGQNVPETDEEKISRISASITDPEERAAFDAKMASRKGKSVVEFGAQGRTNVADPVEYTKTSGVKSLLSDKTTSAGPKELMQGTSQPYFGDKLASESAAELKKGFGKWLQGNEKGLMRMNSIPPEYVEALAMTAQKKGETVKDIMVDLSGGGLNQVGDTYRPIISKIWNFLQTGKTK